MNSEIFIKYCICLPFSNLIIWKRWATKNRWGLQLYDVMAQRRERGWHKSWKITSGLVISLCFSFSFSMQLLYFLPGMSWLGWLPGKLTYLHCCPMPCWGRTSNTWRVTLFSWCGNQSGKERIMSKNWVYYIETSYSSKKPTNYTAFPLTYEVCSRFTLEGWLTNHRITEPLSLEKTTKVIWSSHPPTTNITH